MRLDKYLSNATDFSRSEVKRLIRLGEVTIDNTTASNPAQKISGEEVICISGASIQLQQHRYFMLHKPIGVVSSSKDSDHPTAIDLIDEHRSDALQIAGRLDIDTTGLLLITDDGQWNHQITSPRSHCKKVYRVEVAEPLDESLVKKFAQGIWLANEKRRCLPAKLEIIEPRLARLTISEGKFHQVKRMFHAFSNEVLSLHREKIGGIWLDSALAAGDYRALTPQEIQSVYRHD